MEIDLEKTYVILEIHPRDAFFEFREELVGQEIILGYVYPSTVEEGDFVYCQVKFANQVVAENIILSEAVFHAIRIGEKNAEHDGDKTQAKASKGNKNKEAPESFRAQISGEET